MNIIYGLIDPHTFLIRYIGKSSTGMKRPRHHMRASKRIGDSSHKANWIRELVAANYIYDIVVIERVDTSDLLDAAERRWIAHGRAQGWPLTNLTEGGEGATSPMPEATREKIKEACSRPEARAKMSIANVGVPKSEAHKKAMSAAHKGIFPTPEARNKMSTAHTGLVFSEKHRSNIAASKLGKPRPDVAARTQTPEHQAHLAQLHEMARGRPRPDLANRNASPEQRTAVSQALRGRKFSEETLARMRAGQQRRWARVRNEDER